MTDREELDLLLQAAREHRQARNQAFSDELAQLASMPCTCYLWTEGHREIVSVRGDVFQDFEADMLALFSSLANAHVDTTTDSFVQDQCVRLEDEKGRLYRRKESGQLVFHNPLTPHGAVNGSVARKSYIEMLDFCSLLGVKTVSILAADTFGNSEFDCYDASLKWIKGHRESPVQQIRLVDKYGWFHQFDSSYVRKRWTYSPYDNTEMFPIWKIFGRPFI